MRFHDAEEIAKLLDIQRPLTFFDVETTGPFETDRIVQIGFVRVAPGEDTREAELNFDPEVSIPAEVVKVHGITNENVAGKPKFRQQAKQLQAEIFDGDICAFNGNFDIVMLRAEFRAAGIDWRPGKLVDPFKIFVDFEPRNLEAAVKFYLGERLTNAHTALADTHGMIRIFAEQLKRYDELPKTVDEIHYHYFERVPEGYVDPDRKLAIRDGDLVFTFGKNKGKKVKDHLDYAKWMLDQSFSKQVKDAIRELL